MTYRRQLRLHIVAARGRLLAGHFHANDQLAGQLLALGSLRGKLSTSVGSS